MTAPTSVTTYHRPANRLRWGSQAMTLLEQFVTCRRKAGLSDEEAAKRAGLYRPGVMYWSRCVELRNLGLIESAGTTISSHGETVQTCTATEAGRKMLAEVRAGRSAA